MYPVLGSTDVQMAHIARSHDNDGPITIGRAVVGVLTRCISSLTTTVTYIHIILPI